MSILTFTPDLYRAGTVDFSLRSMTAHSPQSAFNQASFTSGPVSEFWEAAVVIVPMTEADLRALRALLIQARAGKNKFRLYDPSSNGIRGAGGLSTVINISVAAVAGAETITLKNLVASQAVALAAGDHIGIGENLHMVVSDTGSDGDGKTTVSILPALRLGVAVDDPVTLVRPTGLFRLMNKPQMLVLPGQTSQPVSLEFMEDPDVDA